MAPKSRLGRSARDARRWSSDDVDGDASYDERRERMDVRFAAVAEDERPVMPRVSDERAREGVEAGTSMPETGAVDAEAPSVLKKLQKWGDYESCGDVVRGTKLIPMKTPLSARYVEDRCAHALTMDILLREQRALGREIGLIVDLTNHDCLYEEDVPASVSRTHVRNVAKTVPSVGDCRRASKVVNDFLSSDAGKDRYVAVHCAYGFNRTGFMICCHLVETLGVSPEEALELFAEARPPGLKHQHFRCELIERYAALRSGATEVFERRRHAMRRSFESEPDFLTYYEEGDVNDSLDIDMSRKHWMSAKRAHDAS
ncbi:Protein-tyrosine phosphatase, active site [Ostreococcus tauri]|uniref:Protein-tyrosine phosphatase, active site n=1 Tax=Ostreococcus tauri TaxID=70448 RepID=A0A090M505_OSTTA|nr:Protein-tyrosine phosphatase, active site [Ostreococcus tauri]CEF97757.1 Protein-tyrosine phosphatase, active site [Ostreococcus tauri]|eukprot:XP_003079046.2 Protein-tyrosine phosphatase, active site [Ostreococcus tauri]